MRWKMFCLIIGIVALISCSEQSIDENLPTAQSRDGLTTEASNDVPVEIPPRSIIPGQPSYINLTSDDSVITVGGEFTVVHAIVLDEHGWPVGGGVDIRLEITAAPAMDNTGPSFEHVPFDTAIHVVEIVTDEDGIASEELYSGTRAGTVRIKATWIDDETVFLEKSLIRLIAGPPAFIAIGPSNIAEPNGNYLCIGLAAMVCDEYSNPVIPDSPIQFEAIPDSIVTIIEDTSFTIAWLCYTCEHVFDTVRIIASLEDLADTSGPLVLSIWDGQIYAWANPSVIYIDEPETCDSAEITAQLLDGMGCQIHNGILNFDARVCGELIGQTTDTTDIDGFAQALFQICYEQIPDDPPNCIANVRAKLRGYPDVEGECEIYCQRVE